MAPIQDSSAPGATLTDLPDEVLLEHFLPVLPLKDLTSLSATCKHFHALCVSPPPLGGAERQNDEPLWHHKTLSTFRVSKHTLAPPTSDSGWSKRLYQGLTAPRVFVWGEANHGRLGLPQPAAGQPRIMIHLRWVHTPREITLQFLKDQAKEGQSWTEYLKDSLITYTRGAAPTATGPRGGEGRVVEMQAGGWSFAARDMEGGVWVWGQMDGSAISFRADSWEDKCAQVPEPARIPLPCQAEAISCGRRHLVVLDSDNLVWEMTSYGRAYHHTSSALTSPTNPGSHHIVQLSTGWEHSAVLTSSGKIHFWCPFSDEYKAALTPDDQLNGPVGPERSKASRGLRWGTVGDVLLELPPIPLRPDGEEYFKAKRSTGDGGGARRSWDAIEAEWAEAASRQTPKGREEGEKVVRISSGSDFVLALKKNGEVWYHEVNVNFSRYQWEYLPFFSGPQVSHITAQFQAITSYSPSAGGLYHTRLPENRPAGYCETLQPDPLPTLQHLGVIQVAIGDHHAAALTSAGDMYTWGSGSQGQLGLGGSIMTHMGFEGTLNTPQKVAFPAEGETYLDDDQLSDPQSAAARRKGEKRGHFVFSITAAGMHTGALVLGDPTDKTPLPRPKGAMEVDRDDQHPPPVQQHIPIPREPLHYDQPGAFPPTAHPEDQPAEDEDRWSIAASNAAGADAGTSFQPPLPAIGAGGAAAGTLFPGGPMFRVGYPGRGSQLRGGGGVTRNWHPRGGATIPGGSTSGSMGALQVTPESTQAGNVQGASHEASTVAPADNATPTPTPEEQGRGGEGMGRGGPVFRVGYAGRGSHIGGVANRNWNARNMPSASGPPGGADHPFAQEAAADQRSQVGGEGRSADDLGNPQGTGRGISGGSYTGARGWNERQEEQRPQ